MGCSSSQPEDTVGSPRATAKSLSSYNKTKGGSMLFNLSSRSHIDPKDADFTDDQHIMSPPKPDWKVGKALKRAPNMKETHYFPVLTGEEKVSILCAVGYKTLQGRNPKPPHKPNQDSLSVFTVFDDMAVFAVFDGHGPYGEHASHYCRSNLHHSMVTVNTKEEIVKDPKKALEKAIADVHKKFCSEQTLKSGVDPVVSGTTCIACLLHGKTLYTANVGDSRAIMGSIKADHDTEVTVLSDDHKPQRPDERKRLEESKAVLLTEREVRGFGDDSKVYICREKGGDIVYGVLFTRSVGDLDAHKHLGISAEPEFDERTLRDNDRYLVLASDGIWDYMTNKEVMDIILEHGDPLLASNELAKVATKRWQDRDQDNRRDDITVLVVKLDIIDKNGEEEPEEEKGKEELIVTTDIKE